MKLSTALFAAVSGLLALTAGAFEYTFSGNKNVMDTFRYPQWVSAEKLAKETSFQNVDGRLMLAVSRENPSWLTKENEIFRDGTVTFKFQMVNSGNVTFRVRDQYKLNDYYSVQFQPSQKRVSFAKRFQNKNFPLGKGSFTPSADKKYELKLICKGNTFSLVINGQLIGTWKDANSPLLAGYCGFGTNWGTKLFLESFSTSDKVEEIKAAAPAEKPAAPVVTLEKKK